VGTAHQNFQHFGVGGQCPPYDRRESFQHTEFG
jgi:hypothetical protein